MKVGIIGKPQVGKTTLFKLLTGTAGEGSGKGASSGVGVMNVPDERVDWLAGLFKPERTIYARIELLDIQAQGGQELLNAVRNLDALIVVVGTFMDPGDASSTGIIDDLETEFFVSDLASVEGRLERLASKKSRPISQAEIPFLEKCKAALDRQEPLRNVAFEPYEKDFLANFSFYTMKPLIIAANLSEEQLLSGSYPGKDTLESVSESRGYPLVIFCGAVEEEIAGLPPEDRIGFLKEYGLTEPGVSRIAKAAYQGLGLISFFTVGSDEVRAWTVERGANARQAAGKIHSDMEKGFIRAEVVAYQDLHALGSLKACREKGLIRLEGKDYIVQDGDIMTIRFNV